MYSRKSCIHPMFHLKVKPRPSSSGWSVTFGQAVDSSAMTRAPWLRPWTTVFRCLKELNGFQVLVAAVLLGTHWPLLASVVQVQHGGHRVHPEAVHMVLFHPVK